MGRYGTVRSGGGGRWWAQSSGGHEAGVGMTSLGNDSQGQCWLAATQDGREVRRWVGMLFETQSWPSRRSSPSSNGTRTMSKDWRLFLYKNRVTTHLPNKARDPLDLARAEIGLSSAIRREVQNNKLPGRGGPLETAQRQRTIKCKVERPKKG